MERSTSERMISALAYGITLLSILLVFLYAAIERFSGAILAGFAVAIAAVLLLTVRISRSALTHAVHAACLYLFACLFAILPRILRMLQGHGFLAPHPMGNTAAGAMIDPLPFVLPFLCLLFGLPLVFITYEALAEAWNGDFLDHWPPLEWIRTWLMSKR